MQFIFIIKMHFYYKIIAMKSSTRSRRIYVAFIMLPGLPIFHLYVCRYMFVYGADKIREGKACFGQAKKCVLSYLHLVSFFCLFACLPVCFCVQLLHLQQRNVAQNLCIKYRAPINAINWPVGELSPWISSLHTTFSIEFYPFNHGYRHISRFFFWLGVFEFNPHDP